MKEYLSGLNVYCYSDKTYKSHQDQLYTEFSKAAHDIMRINGERSKQNAIAKGHVTKCGVPYITASGDAAYPIRSFGSNFKSPAGTVSLFDADTGGILSVVIYNSFCYTHKKAANKGVEPPEHTCYRNWDPAEPITAIESAGMLRALQQSVPDHGVIVETIITDEDSSVYKTIRDNNVYREYKIVTQRKLCTNHLRKNLGKKLKAASTTTQPKGQKKIAGFTELRDHIKKKTKDIVQRVDELVEKRLGQSIPWDDKVKELQRDILNVASHIFGEHRSCLARGDECTPNFVDSKARALKAVGLYQKVQDALAHISRHSDSLLFGATTNDAEQFHSLVCHLLGGKRIDWCLTNLYHIRVWAAVLSHATQATLVTLYTYMNKKVPRILMNVTQERIRKTAQTRERRATKGRTKKGHVPKGADKYYSKDGTHHQTDISLHEFDQLKKHFIDELKNNQQDRQRIERETVEQRKSSYWQSLRRDYLTASNFREACQWRIMTSCANRIKKIMYPPTSIDTDERVTYGHEQEELCKNQMSELFEEDVRECGLFIDSEHEMLACTPDALVGAASLVEIKCPHSAANMTVQQALTDDPNVRKIFHQNDIAHFVENNNNKFLPNYIIKFNKTHAVYYQIQGQLHILKFEYGWLVIHTPLSREKFKVPVDHVFWKTKMEQQLLRFYNDCMLPEIIDSRHNRKMAIRNPQYTIDAIEKRKKNTKVRNTNGSAIA